MSAFFRQIYENESSRSPSSRRSQPHRHHQHHRSVGVAVRQPSESRVPESQQHVQEPLYNPFVSGVSPPSSSGITPLLSEAYQDVEIRNTFVHVRGEDQQEREESSSRRSSRSVTSPPSMDRSSWRELAFEIDMKSPFDEESPGVSPRVVSPRLQKSSLGRLQESGLLEEDDDNEEEIEVDAHALAKQEQQASGDSRRKKFTKRRDRSKNTGIHSQTNPQSSSGGSVPSAPLSSSGKRSHRSNRGTSGEDAPGPAAAGLYRVNDGVIVSAPVSHQIFDPRNSVHTGNQSMEIDRVALAKGLETRTSVMIKNLPNKYTERIVMKTFHKFKPCFDFFYMPVDAAAKNNMGYAFVNFRKSKDIIPFYDEFHGHRWARFNSKKICNLAFGRIQGKQNLIDHFLSTRHSATSQPVLFRRNGKEVPFDQK